jgi:hypothetical protein
MTSIEIHYITGEKLSHTFRKRLPPRPGQQVKMVRQESPGINDECPLLAKIGKAVQKIYPVCLILEYLRSINATAHHVMQGSGSVESWLPGHLANI